jgi:cGMP-dependent protein kinase
MDKKAFDLLLGPLEDIKKRGESGGQSKVGKGRTSMIGQMVNEQARGKDSKKKILRNDLTALGLLGCGGFGMVQLVEHKVTKETYALKALSKGYIVKCGMKKGVMSEKNIQWMCDSPFIVKLYETFNGEQSLYFLLELALGGELYATYSKKSFHGSERHARFYVAGTVYAFEHLHDKKIIFRDLKPENLLLTEEGRIKLTDMGLAKVVVGKTYTTCGTPDYFAPELIASIGHTHAVDWWTLGILTFELMSGHPPFESAAPMQIYSKVTKGINKVNFPAKTKGPCEDLVKCLCKKEPTERLPMKKGGIENIMKHPWYVGFEWNDMRSFKMEVPYKPKVKSKTDIANFSARKEDAPPQIKYKDDGTGWDKDFATSS